MIMKQQKEKTLTLKDFLDTIKDLRESLASKQDLEGLATKQDVEDTRGSVLDAIEDLENRIDPKLTNHEKRISALERAKN